jgi:predicted transcriptional regulator
LEDGRKLKMIKRHLKAAYNLTPQEYRERWGLPNDYPMVAPNYGKQRSMLAKKFDLGKSDKKKKAS